jgi:HlyD family secretion protein
VLRRAQESESVVAAGAPLLEIGDLQDLEIVMDVLSRDAVRVQPGAKVVIADWGGPRELAGRVRRVEPSGFTKTSALGVEEQRVNVVIEIVDPPAERPTLGDGFRVEARIVMTERADVLTVPAAALFRVEQRWAVFVVRDGTLLQREVQIGERNEEVAEVLSGLQAGEEVVVYPGESLADGVRVSTRAR